MVRTGVDSSMILSANKNGFGVKAYQGDAKTLLAFNLTAAMSKKLAGFTVSAAPDGASPYFLNNFLPFAAAGQHAFVATESPHASVNAPFQKFRWVHVPGIAHQGTDPFVGPYMYTATPRYFSDAGALLPLDDTLSVSLTIDVGRFRKGAISVGNTRGYTQSQGYLNHFGPHALLRPTDKGLLYDTGGTGGTDKTGKTFTYADQYEWLGYTAREMVFEMLNEVVADETLKLDVFAYDLNEPDVLKILLDLAGQGRVRIILDNAKLHHSADGTTPEDQFEVMFRAAAKGDAGMLRGRFARFSHHKVFIISDAAGARKVLTGSTNFSVTGLYVNSNHVIVFDEPTVASAYANTFDACWGANMWGGAGSRKFNAFPEANTVFTYAPSTTTSVTVQFSPHTADYAAKELADVVTRIKAETAGANGNVLFAVMGLKGGSGPLLPALNEIHADPGVFSYGISDTPDGVALYTPKSPAGVVVTGKPKKSDLPPPFSQVVSIGLGHQVHDKFIVCGLNGPDPTVYCGSSNLALMGEQENGDNLICIRDAEVAAVFAIEAMLLVDHFNFLDSCAAASPDKSIPTAMPVRTDAAVASGLYLAASDSWTAPYFDADDLKSRDRQLFA